MIFVTGATGYAGRFVVDALLARGESVRCLVRPESDVSGLDHPDVSLVAGDLTQPGAWVDALAGADAVVSVAHIRFAESVIAACGQAGISRVVFFSSMWRFSKVKTADVDDVVAGEALVEGSKLDYTLLRPTMIYGPGDDRNISSIRDYLRRRRVMPIFGSGENMVQPVYVTDVAQAVVGALGAQNSVGKAYALSGGAPLTYNQMIDTLSLLVARTVIKVHIPAFAAVPVAFLSARLFSDFPIRVDQIRRMGEDRSADHEEAKRDLSFLPRRFKEGVWEAMQVNGVQL